MKLRIALIVDSATVTKNIHAFSEWCDKNDLIQITHIIIQNITGAPDNLFKKAALTIKHYGWRTFLSRLGWLTINKIERRLLSRQAEYKDFFDEFDLRERGYEFLSVSPIISKSRLVYRYQNHDTEKIKALHLDALIRCGSGILKGDILGCAKHGILSFHHADNKINRGGPAGFWEVFDKSPTTGFVIQQLTEELDGGNIVARGYFPTQNYFTLNNAALMTRSNYYLQKLLVDLANTHRLPTPERRLPYYNKLYKTPTIFEQIAYAGKLMRRKGYSFINSRLLDKRQVWGVAFQNRSWEDSVLWRGHEITPIPNHFIADPFLMKKDGTHYCMVEEYDFSKQKAHISAYRIQDNKPERLGIAIEESFHMSFPYLFKWKSGIYMVPETCEDKTIRIYRAIDFPLKWELEIIAMEDVTAADSMIFEHNGLWWLFTNLALSSVDNEVCSELSIFFSDNPLSDTWTPHPLNPIYINPEKARNGGILFKGESIYRVNQRQGFNQYGQSFEINEIVHLDQQGYKENTICAVEPRFFNGLCGTHHMNGNGEYTVYDFVRFTKRH